MPQVIVYDEVGAIAAHVTESGHIVWHPTHRGKPNAYTIVKALQIQSEVRNQPDKLKSDYFLLGFLTGAGAKVEMGDIVDFETVGGETQEQLMEWANDWLDEDWSEQAEAKQISDHDSEIRNRIEREVNRIVQEKVAERVKTIDFDSLISKRIEYLIDKSKYVSDHVIRNLVQQRIAKEITSQVVNDSIPKS